MNGMRKAIARIAAFFVGGFGMNLIREEVAAYGLLLFLALLSVGIVAVKIGKE